MPSLIIATALRLPKRHRLVWKTDGKEEGCKGEEEANRNLLVYNLPDSVNTEVWINRG